MSVESLKEMHKAYEMDANHINGWRRMSKTELANRYCDADESGDKHKRDQYFSALMCKYWNMIDYLYNTSQSLRLEIEDFQSWLAESLMIGFKYRRWRDPNFAVYYDEKGAEKVFNQCITSTRQRWYKYYNQDKRKINQETCSLDEFQEVNGEFIGDMDEDELDCDTNEVVENESDEMCRSIVDYYLSRGKVIEALIVDGICFCDTQKVEKYKETATDSNGEEHEYPRVKSQFSQRMLVKHLNTINEKFINYFLETYNISNEVLVNNITKIQKSSNTKLYKYIDDTIIDMRNNSDVRRLLCC